MNKKFLKLELDLDFTLIAITSPLKDYRLCFSINKVLNISFKKIDDLEIDFYENNLPKYFSRYNYEIIQTEKNMILLANKGSDGFLIPEMRETDYFILIKDFIDEEDLAIILSGLNQIKEIQVAVEINPRKLKSKENLIF